MNIRFEKLGIAVAMGPVRDLKKRSQNENNERGYMYASAFCQQKQFQMSSTNAREFFQAPRKIKLNDKFKLFLIFSVLVLSALSFAGPKNPKLAGGNGGATGRSN